MATTTERQVPPRNDYPTSDGRPMAETDQHRKLMTTLIETLDAYYASEPMVYVSGNLLLFYEPGNKRRHVSPDVLVVKGVPKSVRPNYLTWEEGKGPDVVIELTSSSTRDEDVREKFQLYQDTLRVPEYFLFDPLGDYLDPPLRGYRLRRGRYAPMRPLRGRLPSKLLGLHLERHGEDLRLYDPTSRAWLPTPDELRAQDAERRAQAEARAVQAEARAVQAEARAAQADTRAAQVEAENERLRRELEQVRRRRNGGT